MIEPKTDDQSPCMVQDPSRQIDEIEPHGLHALRNPATLEDQVLHGSIEVKGKDHDPPPGGILPELARGEPASGKVLFHDSMSLFGLATAFMMPADKFPSFPVHIRYQTEELVLDIMERDSLKRETVQGQVRLFHHFPDGEIPVFGSSRVGDKRDLGPFSGNGPLRIEEGMPFFNS